jgi:hypothetical protein
VSEKMEHTKMQWQHATMKLNKEELWTWNEPYPCTARSQSLWGSARRHALWLLSSEEKNGRKFIATIIRLSTIKVERD